MKYTVLGFTFLFAARGAAGAATKTTEDSATAVRLPSELVNHANIRGTVIADQEDSELIGMFKDQALQAEDTTTCHDTPDWVDRYGHACSLYELNDSPGCPKYGDLYEGSMGLANDNCCYCGAIPGCTDASNWSDMDDDGCEWYEQFDSPGCPKYGTYGTDYEGSMGLAKDNCCYCAPRPPTPSPTTPPTPKECQDTPDWHITGYKCSDFELNNWWCLSYGDHEGSMGTANTNCCYCGGGCTDTPEWVDEDEDGCDAYEQYEWCPLYGNTWDGGMGVANDNCCYCAATNTPTH